MRYIYTFLLATGLAACALSPQVVVVNPELKVATRVSNANPISISIEVVDTRSSAIIGRRGGLYAETSDISTDENMTATLQRNVASAFGELGYVAAKKGEIADVSLTIRIIKILYATNTEKKVLKNIETNLEIQVACRKNGKEFTGSYSNARKKDLITSPSEQENEQLVNAAFTVVLESMLKDNDLITFIDG